jgi:hypothetical protein
VAVAAGVLAIVPGGGRALAASPDPTFHLSLRPSSTGIFDTMYPTGLAAWTLTAAPASPAPDVVNSNAAGDVAAVTAWDPATKAMALQLFFTNKTATPMAGTTAVIDMISPAWDGTYSLNGVQVAAGHGARFADRIAVGAIAPGASASASVPLLIGLPGTVVPPRVDVYYHLESGSAGSTTRYGFPATGGPLPKAMAKIVPPPLGTRYLGVATVDNYWGSDEYLDRFTAKYGFHPAIYNRQDLRALPDTPPAQFAAWARVAAQRGTVAGFVVGLHAYKVNSGQSTGDWSYQTVIDGLHDAELRAAASAIRDEGYPVIGYSAAEFNTLLVQSSCGPAGTDACSTNTEFTESDANAYGDPTYPDGSERLRDFHRHIVDIFDEVGAANVTWAFYPENSHYETQGSTPKDGTISKPWWDAAAYYYPGDDYIDQVGFMNYQNFPNPEATVWRTAPISEQWSWHKSGYYDWLAVAPTKLVAMPEEMRVAGALPPSNSNERSGAIREWFDTLADFPRLQFSGIWEAGAEDGFTKSEGGCGSAGGYCVQEPGILFKSMGSADYGFFHPSEIDTFRQGLRVHSGFLDRVILGADVAAPGRVSDVAVSSGPGAGSVTVTWTATGDDGTVGTVDHDRVRLRPGTDLSDSTWSRYGTVSVAAGAPLPAGSSRSVMISGLAPGTYSVAVKSTDDGGHSSPVSNVVTFTV